MTVERIQLVTSVPQRALKSLRGRLAEPAHFDPKYLLGGRDVDVIRSDGTPLLLLRTNRPELLTADLRAAWPALLRAAQPTNRRPLAQAGAEKLYSGTVGFLKGEPVAFSRDPGWRDMHALFRQLAAVYRKEAPDLYAVLERRPSGLLVAGTPFTTGTVNRWDPDHNARMGFHPDDGNLAGSYSAMTVISAGNYTGGLLVFPRWRVAVDVRVKDVLIADTGREPHGNTEIVPVNGYFCRVSVVAYFHGSNAAE